MHRFSTVHRHLHWEGEKHDMCWYRRRNPGDGPSQVPPNWPQTPHLSSLQPPPALQGDLLDDCVQRNGTWSCLTNSGAWKACALSGDDQPMEEQGLLHVASRNTVGGDACLLPAVLKSVWQLALDLGGGDFVRHPDLQGLHMC